jgi:outer membrane lipoprotein-sorting protein
MNKLTRWAPALAAPVVIVGAAIAVPAIAQAEQPLPAKSPAQVLALIAKSEHAAYSGTITQSTDLGLPDLSSIEKQLGAMGIQDTSALNLITSSHTVRVYTDGKDGQRLQLLDSLAERDVVRNGDSVWLYSSSDNAATHLTFTGKSAAADAGAQASAPDATPADLATKLIGALQPSTTFDVSTSARVAGRAAYRLTLTPKDPGTLVADATVAVDAETGVPLEVSVYAKGQAKPAAQLAFSSIRFGAPDAARFRFTPPKGASVETQTVDPRFPAQDEGLRLFDLPSIPADERPTVTGDGWGAIAELPAGSLDYGQASGGDTSGLLNLLQAVDGGHGLQTALVSVLITDDGRVLAGAVPLTALENAAK